MDVKDVMYFFGDATMCDKMISQRARTHHGCLPLCDVTRVQLRQEEGDGGGARAIALQTGTGKDSKELVVVPEEQKEFWSWTRHIKVRASHSCWDTVVLLYWEVSLAVRCTLFCV